MGGTCRCEESWTGSGCDQRVCNPLCIKHGSCKDGKCQCHQGWNGEHCTIGKYPLCLCVCACVCVEVCVLLEVFSIEGQIVVCSGQMTHCDGKLDQEVVFTLHLCVQQTLIQEQCNGGV